MPTVGNNAAAPRVSPAQIVKSVLFLVKRRARPAGAGHWQRLSSHQLAAVTDHHGEHAGAGAADAEQVQAYYRLPGGNGTAICHHPLPTLLDEQVLAQTLVYAGGRPSMPQMRAAASNCNACCGAREST